MHVIIMNHQLSSMTLFVYQANDKQLIVSLNLIARIEIS